MRHSSRSTPDTTRGLDQAANSAPSSRSVQPQTSGPMAQARSRTTWSIKREQRSIWLIFNTHIPAPVFMSSKGYAFVWNMASQGRMEFGPQRNRFTADSATVADYVIVATKPGEYDPRHHRFLERLVHSQLRFYESRGTCISVENIEEKLLRQRYPQLLD